LWGLLNHSLERSLRRLTPASGLFMGSPAAHTPYFCGSFSYGIQCLHVIACFATLAVRLNSKVNSQTSRANAYDFDPTTSPKKSDKTQSNKKKTAAFAATYGCIWEGIYVVSADPRRAKIVRRL
jgi:hypothetical protein